MGYFTLLDFINTEKRPEFEVFLNDLYLQNDQMVIIPTTNDVQKLNINVRNIGTLTASKLIVSFVLPTAVSNLIAAGAWQKQPSIRKLVNGRYQEMEGATHYCVESEHVIGPSYNYQCPTLLLKKAIQTPFLFNARICVVSAESEMKDLKFQILFVPGWGKSYLRE